MEQERKRTRVLFLSLGTGDAFKKREYKDKQDNQESRMSRKELITYAIEHNTFNYQMAKYSLREGESYIEKETEFVAELLSKQFDPQTIYIIGSVKSCWTSFFLKFCDDDSRKNIEQIEKLDAIEQSKNNGIHSSLEEIKEIQDTINSIYQKGNVILKGKGEGTAIRPHVRLIRYGIDEEQLSDNYNILNDIWKELPQNRGYDVAFDITHSFRSMPIYNLILLNYYCQLSSMDIEISHVYYGMLDVRRENGNVAPIVDLKTVVSMLNRTNGVSEFRNTGNAVTLIPQVNNNLAECLQNLDWATQLNALGEIDKALKELIVYDDGDSNRQYTDLSQMIRAVLCEKLTDSDQLSDYKEASIAEQQFMISRWYLRQNRYGLAIATGSEALRSFLVPMYLEYKDIISSNETIWDENNRKAAIELLKRSAKRYEHAQDDAIGELIFRVDKYREDSKKIRDCFAHNLMAPASLVDMRQSKQIIEAFITALGELTELLKDPTQINLFREKYCIRSSYRTVNTSTTEASRIFIGVDPSGERSEALKRSNSGRNYTVYRLDPEIQRIISRDTQSGQNDLIATAAFLGSYLEGTLPGVKNPASNIQLVFSNLSEKQIINYLPYLQYIGFPADRMFLIRLGNTRIEAAPKFKYITVNAVIPEFDEPQVLKNADVLAEKELINV